MIYYFSFFIIFFTSELFNLVAKVVKTVNWGTITSMSSEYTYERLGYHRHAFFL